MVNVWQSTLSAPAYACISVVRTLKDVAIKTLIAVATITQGSEVSAHGCGRVNANVGIVAGGIGTFAAKKMQTCGYAFRGRVMGEITGITFRATARLEEFSANRDLGWVVDVWASGPFCAST